MAKLYVVDMNIDTSDIAENILIKPNTQEEKDDYKKEMDKWLSKPEKNRGPQPVLQKNKDTGAGLFKNIVMQAISQVHKQGNAAVLRRTQSIADRLDIAIMEDGKLKLTQEDHSYMQSAMSKAGEWINTEAVAKVVLRVLDTIAGAEVLDTNEKKK